MAWRSCRTCWRVPSGPAFRNYFLLDAENLARPERFGSGVGRVSKFSVDVDGINSSRHTIADGKIRLAVVFFEVEQNHVRKKSGGDNASAADVELGGRETCHPADDFSVGTALGRYAEKERK